MNLVTFVPIVVCPYHNNMTRYELLCLRCKQPTFIIFHDIRESDAVGAEIYGEKEETCPRCHTVWKLKDLFSDGDYLKKRLKE